MANLISKFGGAGGRVATTLALLVLCKSVALAGDSTDAEPRLSFQSSASWHPRLNVNADVAMVYGVTPTTADRMKSWRDHGYTIDLMTGVAWGEYQDYLFGRFDGKNHEDEAQTTREGRRLGHGKDVYYMSPGPTYGAYLSTLAKKAIDDGAQALVPGRAGVLDRRGL